MEEYPRTLGELEGRFATEEACVEYLVRLRWPQGFICPRCARRRSWPTGRGLQMCAGCGRQTSVTAGTIFQDTRKPLVMWFRAIWLVTSQKTGASALGVQRVLGLGSYQTAWAWLHKLRRAMVRPGRERLGGRIEVDETYEGGPEEGRHGRRTTKKALIVVAAEEDGEGIGRIRMRRVKDASEASLLGFIADAVEPGSVVRTDGWQGYVNLKHRGYLHEVTLQPHKKSRLPDPLGRVHRVISLLKRWLMGTHQGAVTVQHLDYYLDEFTFRFNRRKSASRGKLFWRLLQQAVAVEPSPYKALVRYSCGHDHNL